MLGPADDGGYWLLGVQAVEPVLLSRIAWSTGTVAAITQQRAMEAGLELELLATWYDVDDRAGLERLLSELDREAGGALQPYAAPATAACIGAMRLHERLQRPPAA